MKLKGPVLFLVGSSVTFAFGQQSYQGADRALAEIYRAPEPKPAATLNLALPPKAPTTAKKWLADFDGARFSQFPGDFKVPTLPPVATWPELERLAKARIKQGPNQARDICTLAFIQTLLGQRAQAWATLTRLKSIDRGELPFVAKVQVDLALLEGRKEWIESAYRKAIAAPHPESGNPMANEDLDLSRALTILPTESARQLLKEILRSYDGDIALKCGPTYRKLARDTALSNIGALKHPQWNLADDIDGHELFAAMYAKFPEVTSGQRQGVWQDPFINCAIRYAAYLIANNRYADAVAFDQSMRRRRAKYAKGPARQFEGDSWFHQQISSDMLALLRSKGKIDDFLRYAEGMAKEESNTQNMVFYRRLCEAAGKPARYPKFLQSLPPEKRPAIVTDISDDVSALIMEGKIVEAGERIKNAFADPATAKALHKSGINMASQLVGIGHSLHRQDFIDAGHTAGKATLQATERPFWSTWVSLWRKTGTLLKARRSLPALSRRPFTPKA